MKSEKLERQRLKLMEPSFELRDSYVENLREMAEQDPARDAGIRWDLLENFEKYLELCQRQSRLTRATKNLYPVITYWIVLDGQTAVGKFSLHPVLTNQQQFFGGHFGYEVRPSYRRRGIATVACGLGLEELKRLGHTQVFSTCDEDNLGSKLALVKNGGRLIDRYNLSGRPKPVLKFAFLLDRDSEQSPSDPGLAPSHDA